MNDKTIKNSKIEVSPAELRLKAYRAGIKLRSRQPNRANFDYEETTGQDWSVSLNRWVTKHRIVDRDADRYLEFVVDDETGIFFMSVKKNSRIIRDEVQLRKMNKYEPHNNRMQSNQNVRYALILTSDAGRYISRRYLNGKQSTNK